MKNISDGGVQLLTRIPIKVGIAAYLTGDEFCCIGRVRYCTDVPNGFLVGLQFSRDPHHKNAVADA